MISPAQSSARSRVGRAALVTLVGLVALLLLMALSVFIALSLTSCRGEEEVVDPKAVLAQSSAAMKAIEGFHFVFEVHKPADAGPGSGLDIARIIGDVNSEGSMKADIDVTQSGIPLKLGFVVVGDTQYIQNPLNQQWQSIPIADSPVGDLNLNAGTIVILDRLTEVTYNGRVEKQGVDTYYISGLATAEDVKSLAGAVSTTEPFPIDFWIGVEDYYVYELAIVGPATPNEHEDIWRGVVLSNHNVFVDIQPPQ